jgi:SAM-dependent methyltransferase
MVLTSRSDLACPLCRSEFEDRGDTLVCRDGGHAFGVSSGVLRLVPPDLQPAQRRTAAAFGWQWRHFVDMSDVFEPQFLDWIHPVEPADFVDRDVLDAGCGIGRHAYFAARYGARSVTALDLSEAVDTARETLAQFDDVRIVQGDIMRPPFQFPDEGGGFDLIYSIGVLHHLPDPRAGFLSLARLLRPGGKIAVWVYGHENNEVVRNVIEPLRRLTTRIPAPLLRGIAWPLAMVFYCTVKGIYPMLSLTPARTRLPLFRYITSLRSFGFQEIYTIVFDQLVAPTAAYIRGDELREWYESAGLESITITSRHGNSWRAVGQAPTAADPTAVTP